MLEIERKYLLKTMDWKVESIQSVTNIKQAYLFEDQDKSIRIRIRSDKAFLTIKMGQGLTRNEYEYSISVMDAEEMIAKAKLRCLEKIRYVINHQNNLWEIDVFQGKYDGLVLAEIELTSPNEKVDLPTWIGEEVTDNPAYLNVQLFKNL
jgi:CYTH domain-containing protein